MTGPERIKAALTDLAGITAYADEPANKAAGSAWPVLRRLTRDGSMCSPFVRAYDVFVVLNNNHPTAAANAADAQIIAVVEAVEAAGLEWIEPAETVQIQFDNQSTVPGIRVEVAVDSEEE